MQTQGEGNSGAPGCASWGAHRPLGGAAGGNRRPWWSWYVHSHRRALAARLAEELERLERLEVLARHAPPEPGRQVRAARPRALRRRDDVLAVGARPLGQERVLALRACGPRRRRR